MDGIPLIVREGALENALSNPTCQGVRAQSAQRKPPKLGFGEPTRLAPRRVSTLHAKEKVMTRLSLYEPFSAVFPVDLLTSAAWPEWTRATLNGQSSPQRAVSAQSMLAMPIEVIETTQGWTIRAELAGVAKDQIDIQIESGTVVISARRERRQELKNGERLLRSEISSGAVTRSFSMPAEIDEAAANARFEDGLLTLELPRKQAHAARKLAVN